MTPTVRFLAALLVSAALAVPAAADTFLLVPGVPGDVTEKAHTGWIRIASVDWAITADSSWTKGGGASVGKPNPGVIRLTLASGPWSTAFFRAIGTGKTIEPAASTNPVVVEHVTAEGRPVYRLTLRGFYVTTYQLESEAQKPPLDSVEGVFKTIAVDQYYTGPDGKVRSANIAWDIPAGLVTPAAPVQ